MGQYYHPIATQEGETTRYGNSSINEITGHFEDYHGLKILEHAWWNNDLVNGIAELLYNKEGRVCWVGDYSEDIVFTASDGVQTPCSLLSMYALTGSAKNKLINIYSVINKTDFNLDNKFIVNLSRNEYLDCNSYYEKSKFKYNPTCKNYACINPLPLLTSTGGDQGGGDYASKYPNADKVGYWAYDILKIVNESPGEKCKELNIYFKESEE